MVTIASQVGSDVPYFLHGGQAHVSGTGDNIIPKVSYINTSAFVLILPGIHCSTVSVYGALDSMGQFDDLDNLDSADFSVIGFNRLFKPACFVSSELLDLYTNVNDLFPKSGVYVRFRFNLVYSMFSSNSQVEIKQVLETKLTFFEGQITAVNAIH